MTLVMHFVLILMPHVKLSLPLFDQFSKPDLSLWSGDDFDWPHRLKTRGGCIASALDLRCAFWLWVSGSRGPTVGYVSKLTLSVETVGLLRVRTQF